MKRQLINLIIHGDVTLTARISEGHWLIFDENGSGATYNAPQFVYSGTVTEQPDQAKPANMVRRGYDFGGWYTEATCENEFDFGHELTDKTIIYAKWTANTTAGYTIIFWTQNARRDGYDLADSVYVPNGSVGTNIPYTFVDNGDEDYVTANGSDYHYTGFCLKPNNTPVKIRPEGDSVLNLYYDRIVYTFKFYIYRDRFFFSYFFNYIIQFYIN